MFMLLALCFSLYSTSLLVGAKDFLKPQGSSLKGGRYSTLLQ